MNKSTMTCWSHLQDIEMLIIFLLPNALLAIYWSSVTLLRNLLDDFMKITQFKVIEYYSFFLKSQRISLLIGKYVSAVTNIEIILYKCFSLWSLTTTWNIGNFSSLRSIKGLFSKWLRIDWRVRNVPGIDCLHIITFCSVS